MTIMLDNYIQSFDPSVDAFKKRAHAVDFANYLAGELKLNPKAITVDKDGTHYRVYIPLISHYWSPSDNHHGTWMGHFVHVASKVRSWASA